MHAKPYWNPYLAGVLLGLTLLAAFLVAGQGLGASALPKRSVALVANEVAPRWTAASTTLGRYVAGPSNPLKDWLVIEVVGVVLGGFLGALLAGRFKSTVEKGPRISFAAGLARGCTSGQALSGGALLATGSWAFMMMVFAGGYAFAYLVRRQWI